MFDRILVPLDGSPRAESVLAHVGRLLRREDAEVLLLRVSEPAYSLARLDSSKLIREDRESATSYLKAAAETLQEQGVRCRVIHKEGGIAESILRAAADLRASLIALSTHGRGGVARWIFGSVAEKILRMASVPVLLLRSFPSGSRGLPLRAQDVPFRRLLVPFDGSKTSAQVIPAAAALAGLFGAEVDVLSVAEGESEAEAREEAEKAVARFEERGAKARALTASGDPALKILDVADEEKADLIAMATHGWTGMTRWMLGSVTEKVLRHSTLPMLVVRPERA